jgi:hypothetical protein
VNALPTSPFAIAIEMTLIAQGLGPVIFLAARVRTCLAGGAPRGQQH